MGSSGRRTSRKPRRGTRRRRWGRRNHRLELALKKSGRREAALKNEVARLSAQPVGIWARLKQWWYRRSA
jgi:hypothetical protein